MAEEASRAIEAILMVAEGPVEAGLLSQLLELPLTRVEELIEELITGYRREDRGFVVARVAGGYRYQSHPDLAPYLERFVLEGQTAKLSAAALETLAVIAYKQPISRAQVSAVRGVSAEGVMKTLEQRGYITEVARDSGPGQALLYGTTPEFLEKLGLNSLEELPPLGDFVPGAEIMEALEQSLATKAPAAKEETSEHQAGDDPVLGERQQLVLGEGGTGEDRDRPLPGAPDGERSGEQDGSDPDDGGQ